jgi:Domain of unknown function (DUF6484)
MRREVQEIQPYPLTEILLDAPARQRIDGIVVGTLSDFDVSGSPCVAFPGNAGSLPARSTVALTPADRGREVALMFEIGDPQKPIVLGLIHHPVSAPTVEVKKDTERLVLSADKEIELRCGKASITLTRAGKILLRGEYLLSRSSGVNRIKGGSVQIN